MSEINPKLKPIYAALQTLEFGYFLISKEFSRYALKRNFDEEWGEYYSFEFSKLRIYHTSSKHITQHEEAFMMMLTDIYQDEFLEDFFSFITEVLLEFTKWSKKKLDFTEIKDEFKNLNINKSVLLNFLTTTRQITDEITTKNSIIINENKMDKTKVFIVHGHDELVKTEVARFIEKLNIKPIILHEQVSSGSTIIEKIEKYSNVGFGIVLYTPCDIGAKDEENYQLRSRARQNVIFEHGYLIAKIKRENVCALVKGNVEVPNDISGVVYVSYDNNNAWQYSIAKEMKESGYDIDMNLL